MSSKRYIEVKCDVCGSVRRFDACDPWLRKVWVHMPDYYENAGDEVVRREIDVCDDCLALSSCLRYSGGKYEIHRPHGND